MVDLAARFLNLTERNSSWADSEPAEVDDLPVDGLTELRQPQKRLSAGEVDALVSRYKSGSSVDELSQTFDIHRTTVLDHLKRRDVDRRANKPKLTPSMIEEAVALYTSGLSFLKIAQRFEVDDNTIRRALGRAGVVSQPPGRHRS